jgi:hypothetical protein
MKPRDRPALTAQEFRDDPLRLPAGAALVRAGCRSGRPLPRRPSIYDNAALSDSCPLMPAPGQESGMNRRQFLVASSLGFAGLTFGQPGDRGRTRRPPRAPPSPRSCSFSAAERRTSICGTSSRRPLPNTAGRSSPSPRPRRRSSCANTCRCSPGKRTIWPWSTASVRPSTRTTIMRATTTT